MIKDFDGLTFVAFIDISGFKRLMEDRITTDSDDPAWRTLDEFYKAGYSSIKSQIDKIIRVEGIFVSDCGVLFVRDTSKQNENNSREMLNVLLNVIKSINAKMIAKKRMLTASIAYGTFKYQERLSFTGIVKDAIYDDAYLAAYLDTENKKFKLNPGECRLISPSIHNLDSIIPTTNFHETLIKIDNSGEVDYYYYYWMCKDRDSANKFRKEYNSIYNSSNSNKYDSIRKLIHNNCVAAHIL